MSTEVRDILREEKRDEDSAYSSELYVFANISSASCGVIYCCCIT